MTIQAGWTLTYSRLPLKFREQAPYKPCTIIQNQRTNTWKNDWININRTSYTGESHWHHGCIQARPENTHAQIRLHVTWSAQGGADHVTCNLICAAPAQIRLHVTWSAQGGADHVTCNLICAAAFLHFRYFVVAGLLFFSNIYYNSYQLWAICYPLFGHYWSYFRHFHTVSPLTSPTFWCCYGRPSTLQYKCDSHTRSTSRVVTAVYKWLPTCKRNRFSICTWKLLATQRPIWLNKHTSPICTAACVCTTHHITASRTQITRTDPALRI